MSKLPIFELFIGVHVGNIKCLFMLKLKPKNCLLNCHPADSLLDLGNAADFHGFGVDSTYRAILWVVLWPHLLHQMQEVRRKEIILSLLLHDRVTIQ